jgi:dipeptidase E
MCGPASAWRFITGQMPLPMCDLGWKSLGVLELTALPSLGEQRWVPWVREADVLLVAGGGPVGRVAFEVRRQTGPFRR